MAIWSFKTWQAAHSVLSRSDNHVEEHQVKFFISRCNKHLNMNGLKCFVVVQFRKWVRYILGQVSSGQYTLI